MPAEAGTTRPHPSSLYLHVRMLGRAFRTRGNDRSLSSVEVRTRGHGAVDRGSIGSSCNRGRESTSGHTPRHRFQDLTTPMKMLSSLFRRTAAVTALLAVSASLLAASEIMHWNRVAVGATSTALAEDPLTESRILSIVHIAMHDTVNTITPRFATYSRTQRDAGPLVIEAAVAAAAHSALTSLLPQFGKQFDQEFEARTCQHRNDAAVATRKPGTRPGEYRPTPPDLTPAFASHWGAIKPFVLTSSKQFMPPPPHAPGSREAIADIVEVQVYGGVDNTARSTEQSNIAKYWYENSTCGWNRIACEVAVSRKLDVWEQARLLALVHIAMADGFIAGFEAKYHYHHWRPATAIRLNNDAEWLSYLPTPPVPDYPSTHTVLGAAAAAVIAQCLGTDYVPFSMTSGQPYPGITRQFWSLSQAAHENGASRVFAGIHFSSAVAAGFRQGTEIGTWTVAHALRPRDANRPLSVTSRH